MHGEDKRGKGSSGTTSVGDSEVEEENDAQNVDAWGTQPAMARNPALFWEYPKIKFSGNVPVTRPRQAKPLFMQQLMPLNPFKFM